MRCPNVDCEGTPGERYKGPVEVPNLGVARRHRCPNCRRVFMSLQRTITGWAAEKILLRLEEQDGTSSEKPTESSAEQPGATPSGGTGNRVS